jgi:hypothetical protein
MVVQLLCVLAASLPDFDYYTGSNLTHFLTSHPLTVVFLAEHATNYSFAVPARSANVSFIFTSASEIPDPLCRTNPCVVPFSYRTPMSVDLAPLESAAFSAWVDMLVDPSVYRIVSASHWQSILDFPDPLLVGVDQRPLNSSRTVYHVSSDLLHLPAGLYVYRPQDQQFIPFNGSFDAQAASPLTHWSKMSPGMLATVMGYLTRTIDRAEIEILAKLADHFGPRFLYSFVEIRVPGAMDLVSGWSLKDIVPYPSFLVANLKNMKHERWVVSNHTDAHSLDYLIGFVERVAAGDLEPTVLSEQVPSGASTSGALNRIVGANFLDSVYDDTRDTIVLFTDDDSIKSRLFRTLMGGAAKLLNETSLMFYWIDVRKNDIPANPPALDAFPALVLWPAGKKDKAVVYRGGSSLPNLVEFLRRGCSHQIRVKMAQLDKFTREIGTKIEALVASKGEALLRPAKNGSPPEAYTNEAVAQDL